eukprot:jgi/Bigna1/69618/fgenesh1_pg.9_\
MSYWLKSYGKSPVRSPLPTFELFKPAVGCGGEASMRIILIALTILPSVLGFPPFTLPICATVSKGEHAMLEVLISEGMTVEDLQTEVSKLISSIQKNDWDNFKVALKSKGVVCNAMQTISIDPAHQSSRDYCYIEKADDEMRKFQTESMPKTITVRQCRPESSGVVIARWLKMTDDEKKRAKEQFNEEMQVGHEVDFTAGFYEKYLVAARKCEQGRNCEELPDQNEDGKPVLMLVLFPSASGKTRSTSTFIKDILAANGLSSMAFYSVDGGLLREVSTIWELWQTHCLHRVDSLGCSELNSVAKTGMHHAKASVYQHLFREKKNIMIVDTAADFGITLNPKPGDQYVKDDLKALAPSIMQEYRVIPAAVYARKNQCFVSGKTRSSSEGKKFPNNGFKFWWSWEAGIRAISNIFSHLGSLDGVKQSTFALVRNNYMYQSPAGIAKECKENIMHHIDCGGTGLTLFPPPHNCKLVFKKFSKSATEANSDDYLITPSNTDCYGPETSGDSEMMSWGKCTPNHQSSGESVCAQVEWSGTQHFMDNTQCPDAHTCCGLNGSRRGHHSRSSASSRVHLSHRRNSSAATGMLMP